MATIAEYCDSIAEIARLIKEREPSLPEATRAIVAKEIKDVDDTISGLYDFVDDFAANDVDDPRDYPK